MSRAVPAQTLERQRLASDPGASRSGCHANAGSGKTYVLAQRVIRLCWRASIPRAFSASPLRRRLPRTCRCASSQSCRNGRPTTMTILKRGDREDRLCGDIQLDEARRLFARAVETPGGLKIQTIHAFCERILHLFPFEANVPARFEALDDEQHALLMVRGARADACKSGIAEENTPTSARRCGVSPPRPLATHSGNSCARRWRNARRLQTPTALQSGEFARRLGAVFGLQRNENVESISDSLLK
jgi:ATP-dependent helicase/nuclease subunit A